MSARICEENLQKGVHTGSIRHTELHSNAACSSGLLDDPKFTTPISGREMLDDVYVVHEPLIFASRVSSETNQVSLNSLHGVHHSAPVFYTAVEPHGALEQKEQ